MTTVIDTAKQHSRYGGSSIGAVIACAASPTAAAAMPPLPDGDYSAEGTTAHFVAEQCLKDDLPASHFLDYLWTRPGSPSVEVTGNMIDAVQVYLDAVRAEMALSPDAELYVEETFELDSQAAPGEVWGMSDAVVYHPTLGRVRGFDYKHGVGVSVSPEENEQPMFYLLGIIFKHPTWTISEIICTIVQPRARDVDEAGAVKDWPFDVADLLDFADTVETSIAVSKTAAQIFADPNSTSDERLAWYTAGIHCRWCDASGSCPGKDAAAMQASTLAEDGIASVEDVTAASLPDPRSYDVERLARIVAGIDIVREWQLRAQELLEGMLMSGHAVPGWKVVEKIGRAKWVEDPDKIVAEAELMFDISVDQMMPRKLTTIGDAEKLLKAAGASKEQIDTFKLAYTIKESSGNTIAPSSDRRPAVNAAAENFGAAKL